MANELSVICNVFLIDQKSVKFENNPTYTINIRCRNVHSVIAVEKTLGTKVHMREVCFGNYYKAENIYKIFFNIYACTTFLY